MNKIKLTFSVCIIMLIFPMCEKQTENNDSPDFSLLNGNTFILTVDRVLAKTDAQFPSDPLQEVDYSPTDKSTQYNVSFSENGNNVTIEPGGILGNLIKEGKASLHYELVEGVFAGGRLIVWKQNNDFLVEQTIYGSGVPIIASERGKLKLME